MLARQVLKELWVLVSNRQSYRDPYGYKTVYASCPVRVGEAASVHTAALLADDALHCIRMRS